MSRRRRTRRVVIGVVALAVVLVVVVVAVIVRVLVPGPEKGLPFARGTGPGSVVTAVTLPDLPARLRLTGMHAARVTYRSTGPGGRSTVVSGAVFTPRGDPPAGGWPVIAGAHGTTGIQESCAPSLSPDLSGLAPLVLGYVQAGFAVALPDYQGLGASGPHPYLDNPVAARNLIDSVRALRAVWPGASRRWLAFGTSQGGGAAWSADELASSYGAGLDLVGAVALSPASDLTGLVAKAAAGTLTTDQRPALQWILESLHRVRPGFDLDDYRTARARADWSALSQCAPGRLAARAAAMARLGPGDLAPRSPAAAATLRRLLASMAVARRSLSAPLLVLYGSDDTYIDAGWTTTAIRRQRRLGGAVQVDLQVGRGHADLDGAAVQPWILERFG